MEPDNLAALPPHGRPRFPVIVGRDREQTTLREALEAMLAGQGSVVLVSGDAGIGKTTLVESFTEQANGRGCLALRGGCYDLTITPPYGPWVELVRRYRPDGDLPGMPSFMSDPEAMATLQSQAAFFEQTFAFFSAVAERRPLLLILEDLHWSDHASLDLLRFIARQIHGHRILLAATYRDDEITRHHPLFQLLPSLVRESSAERVELRSLDQDSVHQLVAQRYDLDRSDEDRVVAFLQGHAEGNPLFLRELLRTLEEEALLRLTENGWIVGDLSRVSVPRLVSQAIEGRLERLGEETRRQLQVAAIIGQEVPLDVWQRVTGVTDDEFLGVLERAVEGHLLEDMPDGAGVRFSHALLREALYDSLPGFRRRRWHRLIAEALIAWGSPDPDAVAYHLQQAHDQRAAEWLLRAAERAERTYAWRAAAERLEAVLPLLEADSQQDQLRGWVLVHLSRLLRFTDPDKGLDYIQEARRLATESGDHILAVAALSTSGHIRCVAGDIERGITELAAGISAGDHLTDDECITSYRRQRSLVSEFGDETELAESPPVAVARITSEQLGLLVFLLALGTSRFQEVIERGEAYVARIASLDEQLLLRHTSSVEGASWIDTYFGLGLAYAMLGRPSEARDSLARAYELYRLTGHHMLAWRALQSWLMVVHLPYQADVQRERANYLKYAKELAHAAAGAISGNVIVDPATMWALFLDGEWQPALDIVESYRRHPRIGARWRFDLDVVLRGRLARHTGKTDHAWRIVKELLPDELNTTAPLTEWWDAFYSVLLAVDLAFDSGANEVARSWLEAYDLWLAETGVVLGQADGALRWARYYHATGDPALARRHAEHALTHASSPRQPLALVATHRFLGQLDTESRRFDDACAIPFERALTLLALAELRAAHGGAEDARSLLDEVRAICEPLDARPTLEHAERLAERLSGRRSRPTYPARLTQREVEVLRLIARGMSDREIAEELFISHHTVMRHVSHIIAKLEVESRSAAAASAVRLGLV